jgi:hypothetical protein
MRHGISAVRRSDFSLVTALDLLKTTCSRASHYPCRISEMTGLEPDSNRSQLQCFRPKRNVRFVEIRPTVEAEFVIGEN